MKIKLKCKYITVSKTGVDNLDELVKTTEEYVNITPELKTVITLGHNHLNIDFDNVYFDNGYGAIERLNGSTVDEAIQDAYLRNKLIKSLENYEYNTDEILIMIKSANEYSTSRKKRQPTQQKAISYSKEEFDAVLKLVAEAADKELLPVVNREEPKADEMNIALPEPRTKSVAHARARAIVKDGLGIDLPNRKKWDALPDSGKKLFFINVKHHIPKHLGTNGYSTPKQARNPQQP